MQTPEEHDRLMELVGLVRDGRLDEVATRELESILDSDPEAMAYYVESVALMTNLHRQQGVVEEPMDDPYSCAPGPAPSGPRRRSTRQTLGWASAVCVSLAVGTVSGRWLLPTREFPPSAGPTVVRSIRQESPEIATLSSASGCRWATEDGRRHEGQRLSAETLRLVEGVAVVRFDSDVSLTLQGPAHLDLVGVDRALLREGKAVFRGAGDLDSFTLQTPFSKILDEGTEYAVSVDSSGKVGEIHVFDGRVTCEMADAPDKAVRLDAGEARRFELPNNHASIPLAMSRFVRRPPIGPTPADEPFVVESFAYAADILAGQNGGRGFREAWLEPIETAGERPGKLRRGESVAWPGLPSEPGDGTLLLSGNTGLHRVLEEPIHMDRDAAYYLSFLVRKQPVAPGAKSNGWAYVTLRDLSGPKIAVGPIGRDGAPKMIHNGRVANATMQLKEDTSYLFVCKILARREKNDQVLLRIYGDDELVDSVEPSTWSVVTRPIRDDAVFRELRIYSNNCPPILLDNIRLGKTWSSVTADYVRRANIDNLGFSYFANPSSHMR